MGTRNEFGINMRWLWLGVGLIVAAPTLAVVAYGIWLSSIAVVCTYLDARFIAGPALALVLGGAGIAIGVAGLRSRVSAPAIVLLPLEESWNVQPSPLSSCKSEGASQLLLEFDGRRKLTELSASWGDGRRRRPNASELSDPRVCNPIRKYRSPD